MPVARLEIVNRKGLHARASAKFVETVEAHNALARVSCHGHSVGGDSIMGLLMLSAHQGSWIDVETSGSDADTLMAALTKLVANRFGEDS